MFVSELGFDNCIIGVLCVYYVFFMFWVLWRVDVLVIRKVVEVRK